MNNFCNVIAKKYFHPSPRKAFHSKPHDWTYVSVKWEENYWSEQQWVINSQKKTFKFNINIFFEPQSTGIPHGINRSLATHIYHMQVAHIYINGYQTLTNTLDRLLLITTWLTLIDFSPDKYDLI